MPEFTTTKWVCSRCQTSVIQEGLDQPKTWVRIWYASPPKAAVPDAAHSLGDLCNNCGGILVDFMNGRDYVEEMARAMEIADCERWAVDAGEKEALQQRIVSLEEAIRKVLTDEESGEGGWGPDVTMVNVLKEALG